MKVNTYIGILLLIVTFILVIYTSRSKKLIDINKQCDAFIQYIKKKNNKSLERILNTPFKIEQINRWYEFVGVTLDGGKEVAICTEGEMNDMMHVVIHELAHVARNDIEHDKAYWDVQKTLTNYAIEGGFYNTIDSNKKFCGKVIGDK